MTLLHVTMADIRYILVVCVFLIFAGASFGTEELGVYDDVADDVTDRITNHPIIKQLMSRVTYLEEKDKINTELIGELQWKLEKFEKAESVRAEEVEDVSAPLDAVSNASESDNAVDENEDQLESLETQKDNENVKRSSHERIRQSGGGDTIAFFARASAKNLHHGVNQNVLFDTVVTNIGNGFNSHHGIFIAPVSGVYVFFSTILADNNAEVKVHVAVNGNVAANFYARGTDGRYDSGSQMVILTLNQGDDVSVQNIVANEPIFGTAYTTFSGFLLSPTVSEIVG